MVSPGVNQAIKDLMEVIGQVSVMAAFAFFLSTCCMSVNFPNF